MGENFKFDIIGGDKTQVFQKTADSLFSRGYKIVSLDLQRPWGFYFYIDPGQTDKFISEFYKDAELGGIDAKLPLQPKILAIEPNKRLSWQYHHRRSEIWRCVAGSFSVITSVTNEEKDERTLSLGDVVSIQQGTRHRGVGGKRWSLFAEIWQHTNPDSPSDEDDIVRVQDDFGR